MLPVSGALQLNASAAQGMRPMTSHRCAYSRLLSLHPSGSAPTASSCQRGQPLGPGDLLHMAG